MKYEYKKMLEIAVSSLEDIGFSLERNEDYVATLVNRTQWKIVLGGEPHDRSSFSFSIEDTSCMDSYKDCSYSVYILMDIFMVDSDARNSIDSFVSQVDFLIQFKESLFISPQPYKEKYVSHKHNQILYDL